MTATFRPVTLDDADEVAEVLNAFALRYVGEPGADAESLRGWWTAPPPWNLETDALVAVEDGRIVGYGDIGDQAADGTILWLDVRGDEQHVVHEEIERRARARAAPGGVLRAVAYAQEREYIAFLAERGYRQVRISYRMQAPLVSEPARPVWPDGITVRASREGDDAMLHAVYQEAFSEHAWFVPEPFEDFAHHVMPERGDRSLCFVAEDGDEVAGVAICRPHAEGDEATGWVSILAVRRPWRRRGLGAALLLHAFHAFRERGRTRVALGVDADNTTGAVRLYERAGMTVGWTWEIWEAPA